MSEQKADQTSAESGSLGAGPAVPDASEALRAPVPASVTESMQASGSVESPKLAPEHAGAGEPPKVDASITDLLKIDVPKPDVPKVNALKADLMADLLKVGIAKPELANPEPSKPDLAEAGPVKPALSRLMLAGLALKADPAKTDASKTDASKTDAPKADAPNTSAPRTPGKVMINSIRDRIRGSYGPRPESNISPEPDLSPEPDISEDAPSVGKRRLAAVAAVLAVAAVAGALGGALATAELGRFAGGKLPGVDTRALDAAVARIDADIANLKVSVEHTSKVGMTQFNRTSERLDKFEKAQVEPATKLARLSEAVDKLRVVPAAPAVAAATPVAAKDVTGSIAPVTTPPMSAVKSEMAKSEAVKAEAARSEAARSEAARSEAARSEAVRSEAAKSEIAKSEVGKSEVARNAMARLPTVEGWVLRDVDHGSALIEGRRGMFEVYAGDPVPGLGRVDAIRKQDGRWVVVTSKGLIVSR